MKAAQLKPISLSRNARWSMTLTLYQDKARTTLMSLTGYTVKAQIRAEESQSSALLAEVDAVIVEPAETSGKISLSLTRAAIAAIDATTGHMDVLLGSVGEDPDRIAYAGVQITDGETSWP